MSLQINYPGPLTPFNHQKEVVEFLVRRKTALNLGDIGTGKTHAALWALNYLWENNILNSALIVAPLSTLESVWFRAIKQTLSWARPVLLTGDSDFKKATFRTMQRGEIHIINPDSLHLIATQQPKQDIVIVDEVTMFKNQSTRRFKALWKLCINKAVWGLSGSPRPESPLDVYSIARLICPHRVPPYFTHFRDMTMYRLDMFKWVEKPIAQQIIVNIFKPYVIRHTRAECTDLPIEHPATVIECKPSAEQLSYSKALKEQAAILFDTHAITAVNAVSLRSKLLQIASGFSYGQELDSDNRTVNRMDATTKFQALSDILEETDGPVIVYCNFIENVDQLTEWAERNNIKYRSVDGRTGDKQRLAAFDGIQLGTYKLLIANPQAMKYGLTLTRSNTIVWWTPCDSALTYQQANGRIRRPGQERETYIIHLVTMPIEKAVYSNNGRKNSAQENLLEILGRKE